MLPDELAREGSSFARYLCGAAASDYALARYRSAHELGLIETAAASRFERCVVAIARSGPWPARAMDAYSRAFQPGGLLRRKLVLLLAILESRSPPAEAIDQPSPGSSAGVFVRIAGFAALNLALIAIGLVVLSPVRLVCALGGGR